MNVMPFIGVGFTIAALAGLGLPGLSGFVAELNVFLGGFAPKILLNRVCTTLAILSIVVTRLSFARHPRVLGGPNRPENAHYRDAELREKSSSSCSSARASRWDFSRGGSRRSLTAASRQS